jgi:type IV secretory pathway VirB2 component (pilin)
MKVSITSVNANRLFKRILRRGHLAAALASVAGVLPIAAQAANAAGGITEWETPLQKVVASIDGPVAFGISVIGIVVAGAMLIWGGEINEFSRKLIMLVLVLALIVTAVNLLSTLFGVGALVT